MERTTDIVRKNVHAVLDKYLAGELARDLEKEIMDGVKIALEDCEPNRIIAETNFHD